ncbi:hypothetical protein [uncultured Phascolarctobacterium sp.]|uniref:hypothetical protein n=1 Tax=uncultured Phascolarctobacterium sp. TaxID=512296 RepID=UPI0025974D80|nr:hypothetical protein [uncultured Phascolarctobacterium sp.]
MSENLFAYTATNSGYSEGTAGAINGDRAAAATALSAVKNKMTGLNGDPAFFNFFDRNSSRLVLRQYNYTSTSEPNQIIDPQAATWSSAVTPVIWPGVANLHGVATSGKWLFGTGYDLSKIAVVNMDTNFTQTREYAFPADFPNFANPYADGVFHGEALTVGTDGFLYALFYVNKGSGYATYYDSIVAKFRILANGNLTYISYVTAGKNSFTLDLYDNKLYVCSLGGMQNAGSGNADTNLCIVDLANFTQGGVTKVTLANPTQKGDFRDISILDANNVYIFAGHYDSGFAKLVGSVYHTTITDITAPANWTEVVAVNDPGYLWGIHADGSRLWFVKGTPIAVYDGTPTTAVTASRTFSITEMSDYTGGNLNSACFIAPSIPATRGLNLSVASKSLASHIRLAKEARELAEKAKK